MYQKNILEYFEKTVVEKSDKIAVIDNGRTITFSALSQRSKALAVQLRRGTFENIRRPIGVFLPKSIESVIADLGVIYTGNAYMNLDIKTPTQRIGNTQKLCAPYGRTIRLYA